MFLESKGGDSMAQLLIVLGLIALIIFIVYTSARKGGIYANKIEINVMKILDIKISNKEKTPHETAKSERR